MPLMRETNPGGQVRFCLTWPECPYIEERGALRVLVTGDRYWEDMGLVEETLSELPLRSLVIHGDAPGADSQADVAALRIGLMPVPVPAHWSHFRNGRVRGRRCPPDCFEIQGRPAGPRRNALMLTYRPEWAYAFHGNLAESRGTADMVRRCFKDGMSVDITRARRRAA